MKKIFSSIIMIGLISCSLFAQEKPMEKPMPEEPKVAMKSADHFMFTLTFDNLFHQENDGFKTRWHSRGTSINFFYDIPLKTSRFSFAPGVGFSHSSYYHNSFVVEDADGTDFDFIEDFKENEDYKRHKLTTNYFEIPLELRYRTKPNKKGNMWKLAAGFKVGLKLTATSKEVRKENGYFKKIKTKGFQDVNILRAGPTLRFGYGAFNVIAFYSVTDLFRKNEGPEMTPFSIGLAFTAL